MLRFSVCLASLLLLTEGCMRRCQSSQASKKPEKSKTAVRMSSTIVGKYATYKETIAWYQRLADENKGLVKLINIGRTYEGRSQVVMRISPFAADFRPAIFIEGGMHAREWLSPSTANYLIEKMIEGYKSGNQWYRSAFRKYVFYFMSITNPDGYAFTFDKSNPDNRFWRKNRRPNSHCVGVDLNRNFEVDFGGPGTSFNPCSEIYRGTSAFSEAETLNMKRFAESTLRRKSLQLYISLHTYLQMWVVPFSYRRAPPTMDRELHRAAYYASKAIYDATGMKYTVRNGQKAFGTTTGGSDDWMLAKMNARYSYTLELRPRNAHNFREGFRQPTSQILPTGKDAMTALKALINTMRTVRNNTRLHDPSQSLTL